LMHSYTFLGNAGQFVSVSADDRDHGAAVRLTGPDGSQIENPGLSIFDPQPPEARVNRILPVDGVYVVEAAGNDNITVQVQTCPMITTAPGVVTGAFEDSDCEFSDGRKYDVYTFDGPPTHERRVASLTLPHDIGRIIRLSAEGMQTPIY